MPDPRRIVFEILQPRLPAGFSFLDFERAMARFEFVPVRVAGEMVGAILRDGPELHAAVLEHARGRWVSRAVLRSVVDTVQRHGYAKTAVMNEHEMGHEFARRMGFAEIAKDGVMTHYRKGLK